MVSEKTPVSISSGAGDWMSGLSGSHELVAAGTRVPLCKEGFSRAEVSLNWPQELCTCQDCIKHITGDKEGL